MSINLRCNGWSGVHRFEARYELGPANGEVLAGIKMQGVNPVEFMEKFRTKTYVREVCVKCGAVIEKTKP